MDLNIITQLVGSLGFPIMACIGMFWYMNKEREDRAKETELHKQEMDSMRQSLDNNTAALEKLAEKLSV